MLASSFTSGTTPKQSNFINDDSQSTVMSAHELCALPYDLSTGSSSTYQLLEGLKHCFRTALIS